MPDRLPSLIVLVGFWVPPAVAGWVGARYFQHRSERARVAVTWTVFAMLVVGYAVAWFLFNLGRMPPYIPGATPDPTSAPPSPEAVAWLAVVAGAVVLPGSALAGVLGFRAGARVLKEAPSSREMPLPH